MIVVLLIIIILILIYQNHIEDLTPSTDDPRDTLNIPTNPSVLNEIELRNNYFRLMNVTKHIKLDKFGKVDALLVKRPKPTGYEKECHLVTCPNWLTRAACWRCE